MSDEISQRCLSVLQRVFKDYIGDPGTTTRSKALTKMLHEWLQQELERELPDYEVVGPSAANSKERKVAGKYHKKDVDICVKRDGRDLGVVRMKLVRSNYRQNANNYLEAQMGETANLRGNNIVYGNLMILTHPIIHFRRNKTVSKYEEVKETDVMRYVALSEDHDYLHAPNVQCLLLATISRNEAKVEETSLLGLATRQDLAYLSDDCWNKLEGSLNLANFFARFACCVKNNT